MKAVIRFACIDPEKEYEGYWISPSGRFIGIETDPFKTIWSHPAMFGQNKENMEELYQKYFDEESTIQEILEDQLEKGWIYGIYKKTHWNMSAYVFNRKTADRLWEWAYYSINGKLAERDVFEKVKIHFTFDKKTVKTDFAEMLIGNFVFGHTHLSSKLQHLIDNQMSYFLEEYKIVTPHFQDD